MLHEQQPVCTLTQSLSAKQGCSTAVLLFFTSASSRAFKKMRRAITPAATMHATITLFCILWLFSLSILSLRSPRGADFLHAYPDEYAHACNNSPPPCNKKVCFIRKVKHIRPVPQHYYYNPNKKCRKNDKPSNKPAPRGKYAHISLWCEGIYNFCAFTYQGSFCI